VITAHLDAASTARIRLTPSPVYEAEAWLTAADARKRHPLLGDPGATARFALRDPAVAATAALTRGGPAGRYVPDFLTPKPGTGRESLADQLERLRATPPEQVCEQLQAFGSVPPTWLDAADRLPALVCTGLTRFWRAVMDDVWPHVRKVLDHDRHDRTDTAAAQGLGAMLAGLHPDVRWSGGAIEVDKPYDESVEYADAEIVLVPSLAAWPRLAVQLCNPSDAMIAYPLTVPPSRPTGAAALLGRGRAAVLRAASPGASTSEISRRTGLAPSTVSHHLKILHGTGLLDRARRGHEVIYTRNAQGNSILGDDEQRPDAVAGRVMPVPRPADDELGADRARMRP
jgi:DNA-binding transcriptional ArsR family regulator